MGRAAASRVLQYAAFADKDQVMYTYIICIDHMDMFFYMYHRRGPSACCNAFAIDRVVETDRDTVMVLARASRDAPRILPLYICYTYIHIYV